MSETALSENRQALHEVSARATINMSREQAWEKLQDLSLAHNYVPGLISCTITTEKKTGVGASRVVVNKFMRMDETVVEWNEGNGFRIRLHKGDKPASPFAEAYFTYKLSDAGEGKTTLTTQMNYRLPWGGFGRVLNRVLFGGIVKGQIRDVGLSMKYFYENGEPTPPEALKALKKA